MGKKKGVEKHVKLVTEEDLRDLLDQLCSHLETLLNQNSQVAQHISQNQLIMNDNIHSALIEIHKFMKSMSTEMGKIRKLYEYWERRGEDLEDYEDDGLYRYVG